jgi:putative transposase
VLTGGKVAHNEIRAKIRRLYVPNALYFITGVTQDRAPVLADPADMDLFRSTIRRVKEYHPFEMRAFVFLHEHFHVLVYVPAITNVSKLLQSVQRNFTRNYKREHGITHSVHLWQRGFWDHVIRNDDDLANHFDYIHYNPIKHGYVTKPEEYVHSSFLEYVRRGWYEIGWGHVEPENVSKLDFE